LPRGLERLDVPRDVVNDVEQLLTKRRINKLAFEVSVSSSEEAGTILLLEVFCVCRIDDEQCI
jgi:hypothetical protein